MALGNGRYIDAQNTTEPARYINHTCSPNCRIEKWIVDGVERAAVFAVHDIDKDTELSIDYRREHYESRKSTTCLCGSVDCRGTLEVPIVARKVTTKKRGKTTYRCSYKDCLEQHNEGHHLRWRRIPPPPSEQAMQPGRDNRVYTRAAVTRFQQTEFRRRCQIQVGELRKKELRICEKHEMETVMCNVNITLWSPKKQSYINRIKQVQFYFPVV